MEQFKKRYEALEKRWDNPVSFSSSFLAGCIALWSEGAYTDEIGEYVKAICHKEYDRATIEEWMKKKSPFGDRKMTGYKLQNDILIPSDMLYQEASKYGFASVENSLQEMKELLSICTSKDASTVIDEYMAYLGILRKYHPEIETGQKQEKKEELKDFSQMLATAFESYAQVLEEDLDTLTELAQGRREEKQDQERKKEEKPVEKVDLEEVMAELDGLTGLENIKTEVKQLTSLLQVQKEREARGMKVPSMSNHLVFTGNPGTGKTTIARLIAKIYNALGVLSRGQLVETSRSNLVAGYMGQTATKTQEVIDEAMGGILFIDEAYSLNNGEQDTYGQEAIQTILKNMEDHREDFVVIVAGYDNLMHEFIESNPGLKSRFSKYFHFEDYNGDELYAIYARYCRQNGYVLSEDAESLLKDYARELYDTRDENFGSARTMRNLFEHTVNAQATRLAAGSVKDASDEELGAVTVEDMEKAIAALVEMDAVMEGKEEE